MPDITADLNAARDAYHRALGAHMKDPSAWGGAGCTCGWRPANIGNGHRATGAHMAAAHRRARKAYDAAVAEINANR